MGAVGGDQNGQLIGRVIQGQAVFDLGFDDGLFVVGRDDQRHGRLDRRRPDWARPKSGQQINEHRVAEEGVGEEAGSQPK